MNFLERVWPGLWRDVVLNTVIASPAVPPRLRSVLLRRYGMDIGKRAYISPTVWFGSRRVSIGDGSFINYGCRFNTSSPITIGARCDIGTDVSFVTDSHEIRDHQRRAGANTSQPIFVGDGVWIGARAVILPGVKIGDGAVIAAGAVVTKDCTSDGLYGGVPARRLRVLD